MRDFIDWFVIMILIPATIIEIFGTGGFSMLLIALCIVFGMKHFIGEHKE